MEPKINVIDGQNVEIRCEDYLCSPNYRSAPLGGMNNFAPDCTVVANVPPCPCPECGGKNLMKVSFCYPERLWENIEQGIKPIPEFWFHNKFRGGQPLIPSSRNVAFKNGYLVREPGACEVVFCITTCSNHKRLMDNMARVSRIRYEGGHVNNMGVMDGAVTEADGVWGRQGVMAFEEEDIIKGTKTIEKKNPLNLEVA